jgi:hypothetical protein
MSLANILLKLPLITFRKISMKYDINNNYTNKNDDMNRLYVYLINFKLFNGYILHCYIIRSVIAVFSDGGGR